VVVETGGDKKSTSFWDDYSWTPLELSSTPTQPRSASTSKGREKLSPSRIECYSSLHIHNTLMSQRRTTGGTRTRARARIRSHNRCRQWAWSP
jgi:hypothetical protein